MAADLATLRTAKTAVDEGLITADDYELIKTAFCKAQQIKAGLDAGFISAEDYAQARDSFLHSLDFKTAMPQHAPQQHFAVPPVPPLRNPPSAPMPPTALSVLTSRGSGEALAASGSTPRYQSPTVGHAGGTARVPPLPLGGAGSSGTVAVPADLPKLSARGGAGGKVRTECVCVCARARHDSGRGGTGARVRARRREGRGQGGVHAYEGRRGVFVRDGGVVRPWLHGYACVRDAHLGLE